MIVPRRRLVDSPAFPHGILAVVVVIDRFITLINTLERLKVEQTAKTGARIGDMAARLAPMRVPLEESKGVRRRDPAR
jgi:hypothetical protein